MSYKEIQKRKNLNSRVLQLQVDRFVSNKNNKIIMPSRPIRSMVNKNGFIEVLNGAIESHDFETLESIIPKDVDLSIRQNGGFSVFFWLYSRKVIEPKNKVIPKDRVYYIFKKGGTVDQFTPSVGLIVELIEPQNPGTNQNANIKDRKVSLIIELSTSKSKKEVLFANKVIEDDHLYSIGISFSINYEEDTTEVDVYIDGKLDTQSSIPGEPIHNQGSVFFGRPDSSTHGFSGTVADVMMVPSPINEKEVALAHSEGLKKLYDTNGNSLGMNEVFGEIFKRKKLINKYALYTKKSIYEIENLGLSNSKMLEIVKNYDKEELENDIRPPPEIIDYKKEKMIKEISAFVSDIDNRILCNKIDMNGCLINTCFFLANNGEDMLEIERVLKIFNTLKEVLLFDVEKPFLIRLAKILYAYYRDEENKKIEYLKTRTFFINLRLALDTFEFNEEENEKEQAKFMKKKKAKYKIVNGKLKKKLPPSPPRKNIYASLRRSNQEKIEPLPIEETKGFGNCIPEHEKLMLKTQNIKNSIDIEQEENLPQYHTTFIIKTLYEKPKNLPGEDPEFPNVKYYSTDASQEEELSSENEGEEEQDNLNENNANDFEEMNNQETPGNEPNEQEENEQSEIRRLLEEILNNQELEIKYPELGSVLNDDLAKKFQDEIMEAKKAEEKKKEEEENKKLSEGENKNVKEEKKKEVTEKITYSFDPQVPEGWNEGNFELIINHCYDCDKHMKTTKHYEYYFIDKFNSIGDEVKAKFPKCRVIGNLDEREYLGNFDVYLRYTGLPADYKGRFKIYSKRETKKFPSVSDIVDKLVCLSIMFGSSKDIEKAQSEDIKEDSYAKSKLMHEHPAVMSEKVEKIKQSLLNKKEPEKIDQERTVFYCLNNGCNKEYVEKNNKSKSCRYHKGVYQFGSYNGYWPECWSCCEGKWDSPGCEVGKHKGVLLENRLMLCINHGEQSEEGPPDSVCGTWYTNRSIDGCKYHSGRLEKGIFTCCQGGPDSEGCQQGQHRTAKYPEPEAKLYFYPKPLNNPGVKLEKGQKPPTTADQIKMCGYFKPVIDYPDVREIYKRNQDRIEAEKDMERRCFNVGCKRKYKESGNTDKSCFCHPGKWDFGGNGSGVQMTEIYTKYNTPIDDKIILENIWKPHWTCCGRDWESKPCTKCRHHGPLIRDLARYDNRFRYPDVRYKLNFKRIVGDKWMEYLERNVLSPQKMRETIQAMPNSFRYNELPGLCDKLKMNLLILQEDPSYAIKFWDIIEKSNSIVYFCKDDNVDRDKFLKWWETDYLTICNELNPPKQPEKKGKKEEEKNNA